VRVVAGIGSADSAKYRANRETEALAQRTMYLFVLFKALTHSVRNCVNPLRCHS